MYVRFIRAIWAIIIVLTSYDKCGRITDRGDLVQIVHPDPRMFGCFRLHTVRCTCLDDGFLERRNVASNRELIGETDLLYLKIPTIIKGNRSSFTTYLVITDVENWVSYQLAWAMECRLPSP